MDGNRRGRGYLGGTNIDKEDLLPGWSGGGLIRSRQETELV